jgi:hypothetical protein
MLSARRGAIKNAMISESCIRLFRNLCGSCFTRCLDPSFSPVRRVKTAAFGDAFPDGFELLEGRAGMPTCYSDGLDLLLFAESVFAGDSDFFDSVFAAPESEALEESLFAPDL